jgi:hypothetical protein
MFSTHLQAMWYCRQADTMAVHTILNTLLHLCRYFGVYGHVMHLGILLLLTLHMLVHC